MGQLRREANVWSCYEEADYDKSAWKKNYFNGINSGEEIEWTVHFCRPAIMKQGGSTHAWPTCDPLWRKCNEGKLPEPLAKWYEWVCFNEHMRKEVGYKGIAFEDWMEVKFGEAQLSLANKMKYRSEWAKANFLRDDCLRSITYIPFTVWSRTSAHYDKGKAKKLDFPNG